MNLKNTTVLFFLTISTAAFSQEKAIDDITDVMRVTFLNPGFSYEKSIGKFQSIYGHAFINTSIYSYSTNSQTTNTSLVFDPAILIQYRYYYNYEKRFLKGKRTMLNSLNYLSPTFESIFPIINTSTATNNYHRVFKRAGVVWGIQRNYKNRFSLDLNLGLGYLFTRGTTISGNGQVVIRDNSAQGSLLGRFTLGFWLNKRK